MQGISNINNNQVLSGILTILILIIQIRRKSSLNEFEPVIINEFRKNAFLRRLANICVNENSQPTFNVVYHGRSLKDGVLEAIIKSFLTSEYLSC